MKTKLGRWLPPVWVIACSTPLPIKPADEPSLTQGSYVPGGPAPKSISPVLRPMRQPLYDNKSLSPGGGQGTLFILPKKGDSGGFVYLKCNVQYYTAHPQEAAMKGDLWTPGAEEATHFKTREEAEALAFDFVAVRPWFIGHVEIQKKRFTRKRA